MKQTAAIILTVLCMAFCFAMPALAADSTISISVTQPADKYDGTERANDFYLYGGSTYYSWVEYAVEVAETGIYRLDAVLAVSAGDTAQLKISVDGIDAEGIFDVAPSDTAWEVREAMLHDAVPLEAGTRTLRITQAELISHVTLNSLTLTKTGSFNPPITVDVTAATEAFDGVGRDKDFHFYGGSSNNYSWAKYEIEVPESGMFRPDVQVTTAADAESGLRLEIDGVMTNDILHIPADSGNYVLRSFSMAEIPLAAGTHTVRVYQTVGTATTTLNYFALAKVGEYQRPVSVTVLGSSAKAATVESMSFAGDGYRERSQVRGGHELTFDFSMPTGMYDVSLLVSASEEYEGLATASVNGAVTREDMQIPAAYATDAEAKEGAFYEVPVAEGVWFHTGDNTLTVIGGGTNTKLFYLRGVVLKPAEKHWVVKPTLGAFDEINGTITAELYAENHYSEEALEMVLAVALYQANGELLHLEEMPFAVAKDVPTEGAVTVSVPAGATKAKAFVWEGTSIYDSSMMYYAEAIEQAR